MLGKTGQPHFWPHEAANEHFKSLDRKHLRREDRPLAYHHTHWDYSHRIFVSNSLRVSSQRLARLASHNPAPPTKSTT